MEQKAPEAVGLAMDCRAVRVCLAKRPELVGWPVLLFLHVATKVREPKWGGDIQIAKAEQ